jgi:MoaA/NifB/PqqE/SkfB family radical SAM enzyme
VLWLQLTGGEPLIDKLFPDVYTLADELGMMLSISSNGSRLSNPKILDLLTNRRPYRLTLSVYGATAEAYDAVTRRPGSFAKFSRGPFPPRTRPVCPST